jgi:hypothetical protein
MMKSCLMTLRMGTPTELTKDFLLYAHHVDTNFANHHSQCLYALVDKFDELRNRIYQMLDISRYERHSESAPESIEYMTFIELTTLYGLWGYVGHKLSPLPISSRSAEASSLLHCLLPPHDVFARYGLPLPRLEMAWILLDLGASPNRGRIPLGAWGNTLKYVTTLYEPYSRSLLQRYILIMRVLVLNGANPYAQIKDVSGDALDIVKRFCVPCFPEESAELLHEIHKQRATASRSRSNSSGGDSESGSEE